MGNSQVQVRSRDLKDSEVSAASQFLFVRVAVRGEERACERKRKGQVELAAAEIKLSLAKRSAYKMIFINTSDL